MRVGRTSASSSSHLGLGCAGTRPSCYCTMCHKQPPVWAVVLTNLSWHRQRPWCTFWVDSTCVRTGTRQIVRQEEKVRTQYVTKAPPNSIRSMARVCHTQPQLQEAQPTQVRADAARRKGPGDTEQMAGPRNTPGGSDAACS